MKLRIRNSALALFGAMAIIWTPGDSYGQNNGEERLHVAHRRAGEDYGSGFRWRLWVVGIMRT